MTTKRVQLVDGLRGVAALAVLVFHFDGRLEMSGILGWLAQHGNLGVSLFFVLSGFVIAMSVGDRQISLSFLGRFAARREIRLSPPYIASIFLLIFLGIFGARFGVQQDIPDIWEFLAHLFYLQSIIGVEPLSKVYWSLCLEVQFYFFLIALLWAIQAAGGTIRSTWASWVVLVTIVASLACARLGIGETTLLKTWYGFALGAMVYWAHAGWINRRYAIAAIVIVLALGYYGPWAVVAVISASGLMLASYTNKLDLMSNPVSQFFGRISYSLYLTHNIFGWYSMSLAAKYVDLWLAAVIGFVVAVVSAWVWYWVLERPAVILSRKVPMARSARPVPVKALSEAA
jgi:peptidoglycan/LPS O-acetylase OafA/YrhL